MRNRTIAALSAPGLVLAVALFLTALLAAPEARAACSASVSASVSGTNLTVVGTSSGQCGTSSVSLYLDGGHIGGKTCVGSASCTATVTVSTACLRTGSHTVSATAGCGRNAVHPNGTPYCATDTAGNATTTFSVNTTPTVSVSYAGPDEIGDGTVHVNYNFPNTTSHLQRQVHIYVDGTLLNGVYLPNVSGVYSQELDTTCWRTGRHVIKVVAIACNGSDPSYRDEDETTVTVNTTPEVDVSYIGPDEQGHGRVEARYNFPNTRSHLQRQIHLYVDGTLLNGVYLSNVSGVHSQVLDTTCWLTGPHVIKAVAIACNGSDSTYRDEDETTVTVSSTPEVEISYVGPDEQGRGRLDANYRFPNTSSHLQRQIHFYVDGTLLNGVYLPNVSGVYSQALNTTCWTPGSHEIKARAISCSKNGNPAYEDESTTTVNVDNKPEVSLSYTGSDGNYQLQVGYRFPNTSSHLQRQVVLYRDGSVLTSFYASEVSGSRTIAVSGCGEIKAVATSCGKAGDPLHTAEATTQLPPEACKEDRDSCGAPGKPVNVGSGDVSLVLPIFNIAGQPMPLTLALTYHSARPIYPSLVAEMGRGWHHTFSETVRTAGLSSRFLYRIGPDGQEYMYERQNPASTTWSAIRPLHVRETITLTHGKYRLTDLDRVTRDFDEITGRWLSTTDFRGNSLTAAYDEAGNLSSVSDNFGRTVQIRANGRALQEVTLPNGATWRFTYTNGNLTAIHDPLHTGTTPWRTFVYTNNTFGEPRLLTEMRDDAGVLLEGHAYDNRNRATTSFAAGNREFVQLQYELSGGVTRVTHTIDATTKQVGDITLVYRSGKYLATKMVGSCMTCGATSDNELREYDASGFVTKITDGRGMVTTFTRDALGNMLTRTDGVGTPLARTVTYEYTDPRRPAFATRTIEPSVFGPGHKITEQNWNADESVLTVTTTGRLSATDPGTTSYTTVSTFDALGRLVHADGPRTDVADIQTRSYYGEQDSRNRRGRLRTITMASTLTATFDDYDAFGNATAVTDPNGVVNNVETDDRGRVVRTIQRAVPGDPSEATDYVKTMIFDGRDRLVETIRPLGNRTRIAYEDGTNFVTDSVTVDAQGNERERMHLTRNVIGGVISEEWQSCDTPAATCGSWTTRQKEQYTYDSFNRLKDVVHADGTKVTRTYNANRQVATEADENHAVANITYDYDILGRTSSVTTKLGSGTVMARQAYDVADNVTSLTDQNGGVTTFAYDDFRRRTETLSPVSGKTTFTYDPAGNPVTRTDANGAVITETYDALDRRITSVSARPGTATETMTFTYDASPGSRYGAGKMTAASDPAGTTSYRHDRRGLVAEEKKDVAGGIYITGFTYDANGNRTRLQYPSGRSVDYVYDYADRAYSATSGATPIVLSASYVPFGPLDEVQFGNGTTKSVSYDNRYRMQTHRLTAPGGTIADYSYGYDAIGNITSIQDVVDPAFNRTFAYDDLNRLTTANSGSSLWGNGSFTYDAMSNMKTSILGTRASNFAHAGTTSRLSSATENGVTRSVAYDATGNELTVGSDSFEYSPRNQLLSADGLQYVYDWRSLRTITATRVDLSALSFSPDLVVGGNATEGTVTLTAPAPAGGVAVALESGNTHAAVPAIIHVPAGATSATFAVGSTPTPTSVTVTITASYGTSSITGTVMVTPPSLESVTVQPSTISGGQTGNGRVVLDGPAPQNIVVALSSDNTAAVVPSSVTVPEGASFATFSIGTTPVADEVTATITASYGTETRIAELHIFSGGVESLTFDSSRVEGGHSVTGTVRLLQPAPAGGAIVVLDNENPALLTVPATVTVAAGAREATFGMTAPVPVLSSTEVEISATWRTTVSATLTVVPPSIIDFSIAPTSVEGGQEAVATVTLSGPAAAGTQVTFDSSDPAAWITDALAFAAGATSGQITVRTSLQSEEVVSTLTATLESSTATASITVRPLDVTLASFTIAPLSLIGSNDAVATITLTAPATAGGVDVELHSLSPKAVSLPPYVTVPEGAIEVAVPVTTGAVAEAREITVQARHAVTENQVQMFLLPPTGNAVTALVAGKPRLVGGNKAEGEVTLLAQAGSGGVAVSLASSDPSLVLVPAVANVPPGSASTLFTFDSVSVTVPQDVVVTASLNGAIQRAMVTLIPSKDTVTVMSVAVPNVVGGSNAIGTVVLSGPAPAGGAVVSLSGSRPGIASVPAAVTVPAGATSATFTITTSEIEDPRGRGVLVQASYNHLTRTSTFLVTSILDEFARGQNVQARPVPSAPKCASVALEPCLPAMIAGTIAAGLDVIHPADPIRVSLYSPGYNLLAETEVSTAPQKGIAHEYVWFAGRPVAQFDAAPASVAWTFTDHLGTPQIQTDAAGQVVWRVEYEPYGKVFAFRAGATKYQPLRFPGQEAESLATTERSYNVNRWYRGGWGRYTQVDPDRDNAPLHPYDYANGNPLRWSDPRGLKAFVLFEAPTSLPTMPGPVPDQKCCSQKEIQKATDSVDRQIDRMMKGKAPEGEALAMTISGTLCNNGICSNFPEDPKDYQFRNFSKDPCVNYCINYHELLHFTDTRQWDWNWSDSQISRFLEFVPYIREKTCLVRFGGK